MKTLRIFLPLLWLCFSGDSSAATLTPLEKTLPSGIRVVFLPRPGSGALLTAVAVGAGSQDEPAGRAGLSHFLEHLLFDGYDEKDERGVTEALENHAAYANAFTRDQTTVFFVLAPPGEAPAAAQILTGMLTRSTISKEAFEKEKKVILEELAQDEENAAYRRGVAERQALWENTPGGFPPGGAAATVIPITRDDVMRFWKARYQPKGMRLLIAGDPEGLPLERLLEPFSNLPSSTAPLPPRPTDPLTWPGWGIWKAVSSFGEDPQLTLVGALEGGGPAGEVLAQWLSDSAGPLVSLLVPALAQSVSVSRSARFPRDLLDITIRPAAGQNPQTLLSAVLGALDRVLQTGPAPSDIRRAETALAETRALTRQRLQYAAVLEGEALAAAPGTLLSALEPPPVTREEILVLVQPLLQGKLRAVWSGEGGPITPSALPQPTLPEAVSQGGWSPGPLDSSITILPNGLTLAVREETGSPVFGFHLLVADRSFREPQGQEGIADLTHRLLGKGTHLSPGERFARRLERAGLEWKTADEPSIPFDDRYNLPDFSYVRVEGPASSLREGIALLAEALRQPEWPANEWEKALSAHKQARRSAQTSTGKIDLALRSALFGPSHPLARPVAGPMGTEPAAPDTVKAFWGAWPGGYFNPATLILSVASPSSPEEVLAIVRDLLGTGPEAAPRRESYPNLPPPDQGGIAVPEPPPVGKPEGMPGGIPGGGSQGMPQATPPGMGASGSVTSLGWGTVLKVDPADRAPLQVAVSTLSDWMTVEIREKAGLTYRQEAGLRPLPNGHWVFWASLTTRQENREKARNLFQTLIERLGKEAPSRQDLERVRARAQRREMLDGLTAASRAYRIGRWIFEKSPTAATPAPALMEGVTPEGVKEATRKYLDPGKLVFREVM